MTENQDSAKYADRFAALGSESRLDVMRLLVAAYPDAIPVGDLQAQLKIPNSTLSHHLEKLRIEGLVTAQRDRQFLRYSANLETITSLLTFLYNGCSHSEISQPQQNNLGGSMFENFFQPVQTFLGEMRLKLPGFERFTEKAIQTIVTAQTESRRLRHQCVGTEQLLIGLLTDNTGLVAEVLKAAGVQLAPVRGAIERQIGRGRGTPDKIPFTPRAKETIEIALQQAKQLKHSYIGTEHLLLAILVEGQGLGGRVLEELGFSRQSLEAQLRSAIDQNRV
jgi:ArsR family transcriptional regulator, arsenate/arsenite/antimonite-responsive transcriptional repressor / arsenate reductase (thioredoxin)